MLKNKKIALLTIILAVSLIGGVFAAVYQMWYYQKSFTVKLPSEAAVKYTVLQDLPNEIELDKEYSMIVECTNTAQIPYDVWAYIKVVGPSGFDNEDILVHWKVYNVTSGSWIYDFTIGRGGTGLGAFTNHDGYWVDWTGTRDRMNPGVTYRHYVYVTIFGSAPVGGYSAEIAVTGEGV
jgi:hypothetical protein